MLAFRFRLSLAFFTCVAFLCRADPSLPHFGLNFTSPTTNATLSKKQEKADRLEHSLFKQRFDGSRTAALLRTYLPILPDAVADGMARKITHAAHKIIESTDSFYVTPIGVPCNPNEVRLCFERTTTTTTTVPPDSRRGRRQQGRQQHTSAKAPRQTDYESVPYSMLEHRGAVAQAVKALERTQEIDVMLEEQRRERDFFFQSEETSRGHPKDAKDLFPASTTPTKVSTFPSGAIEQLAQSEALNNKNAQHIMPLTTSQRYNPLSLGIVQRQTASVNDAIRPFLRRQLLGKVPVEYSEQRRSDMSMNDAEAYHRLPVTVLRNQPRHWAIIEDVQVQKKEENTSPMLVSANAFHSGTSLQPSSSQVVLGRLVELPHSRNGQQQLLVIYGHHPLPKKVLLEPVRAVNT